MQSLRISPSTIIPQLLCAISFFISITGIFGNRSSLLGNASVEIFKAINGTYILGRCPHGLCNRLMNLAGNMAVADIKNISNIVYVWQVHENTPNHFLDIFEPIPNLYFENYERDMDTLAAFAKLTNRDLDHGIKECVFFTLGYWLKDDVVKSYQMKMYSKFILRAEFRALVRSFAEIHNISSVVSLHMRRGDFMLPTSDLEFLRFIATYPSDQKFFIMTDTAATRMQMVGHLGADRVIMLPLEEHSASGTRLTSLPHAVVEVMLAALCKTFKGTTGSTMSELVVIYRDLIREKDYGGFKDLAGAPVPPPPSLPPSIATARVKVQKVEPGADEKQSQQNDLLLSLISEVKEMKSKMKDMKEHPSDLISKQAQVRSVFSLRANSNVSAAITREATLASMPMPRFGVAASTFFNEMSDEDFIRMKSIACEENTDKLQLFGSIDDLKEHKDKYFWQKNYEPVISCMFQRRMGMRGDGGKWVCDPHRIKKGCLVYSFGSSSDYTFETAIVNTLGCEVHTFDPFWNVTQDFPKNNSSYHLIGLSDSNEFRETSLVNVPNSLAKRPFMTLPKVIEMLGHQGRTIDILKIDIEGEEHKALNVEMFKSLELLGISVRQLLIEIHHNEKIPLLFKTLREESFYIFHKEPNTMADTECIEYGLLNISLGCPLN